MKKKQNKSVRKSVRAIRKPYTPQIVEKMFKVASRLKPEIVHGMAIQFHARLRDCELFAITQRCWDGTVLRIPKVTGGVERVATDDAIKAWLDAAVANAPGNADAPIMAISRAGYRQALREVMDAAGVPCYPGKSPLRAAGCDMVLATDFGYARQMAMGHKPESAITATFYNGPSYKSWADVASGITPERFRGPQVIVRELADQFGKDLIDSSFSSSDADGHLQHPVGFRRNLARIIQDLVSFAGGQPVETMTQESATGFLEHYRELRRNANGRGISRITLRKVAAMLCSLFNYGIVRGLCHNNPFRFLQANVGNGI